MSEFKPPKPNKALIMLAKFLLPFFLRFVERLSFRFIQSPDRPVEFLKGKKAVIVINHSDKHDPLLLIDLARYMNEEFYCIVARESFDAGHGFFGWMFQRLGCFSVERGAADFRSIHTMMTILTEGTKKLIVFPEGEVTGDDHTVREISPALMKVFLNAQKSIANEEESESIWILPVGVSYTLETKLRASVDETLTEIERRMGIERDRSVDSSTRVTQDVADFLRKLADQYEFELPEQEPQREQAGLLARHICDRIATGVGREYDQGLSNEQLLHLLRSEVSKAANEINHDQQIQSPQENESWSKDFDHVERLLILHRVLDQPNSAMKVCRTIDFLELEILGSMTAKGRQTASVYIGDPIEVLPFFQNGDSDKGSAAEQLRDAVHEGLQSALDNTRGDYENTKQIASSVSGA